MNAAFWRRMRVQAATLLAVLLAATALTFAVTDILPGDAAVAILGETASAEEVAALRASLGLDRGLGERYVEWLSRAARGELGKSYRTNERISTMLADRLPVTLELIALTQVLALALAVPAGILAAYRSRTRVDGALGALSIGLLSMPAFVAGIVLIYVFSVGLGWLPASGYSPLSDGLPANLSGAAPGRASVNHGLKAVQIAASAWTAEALKQCMPASVFSRSTECHNQDKVSMGTISARDAVRVLELTEQVVAAQLLAVTQGVELRIALGELDRASLSPSAAALLGAVRADFPPLSEDRPLDATLARLVQRIQADDWPGAAREERR